MNNVMILKQAASLREDQPRTVLVNCVMIKSDLEGYDGDVIMERMEFDTETDIYADFTTYEKKQHRSIPEIVRFWEDDKEELAFIVKDENLRTEIKSIYERCEIMKWLEPRDNILYSCYLDIVPLDGSPVIELVIHDITLENSKVIFTIQKSEAVIINLLEMNKIQAV